jgi:hypothetical protein
MKQWLARTGKEYTPAALLKGRKNCLQIIERKPGLLAMILFMRGAILASIITA